jgi:hypothetical protein
MPNGTLQLHWKQSMFFQSQAPITIASSGIRGGKTHVGALKKIVTSMKSPCETDELHLVCSPTYPMSKVPVQKIFKLLYDTTIFPECPLIKYYKSDRVFELVAEGGITRLGVLSLHDPDRARGIKAKSAWIDEGSFVKRYAWDVISGRVADSNGPIDITTTPNGYNFVHELYQRALEEKQNGIPITERTIRFFHWTSFENTFIPKEGLERLRQQYDSRTAAQELSGLFVRQAGRIYHGFTTKNIRPWKFQPLHDIIVGQDFNVTKMATVFMQPFRPEGWGPSEGLQIFDERLKENSNTHELAHYLREWCKARGVKQERITIVPDASGSARSTTGKSDHKILREAGFRVRAPRKNPFVKDRINCVNGLLAPDRGSSRLMVDPSCKHSISTLENHLYKEDSDPPEPDKESGLDHIADAIGYPCWWKFPLRMVTHLPQKGFPNGFNGSQRSAA